MLVAGNPSQYPELCTSELPYEITGLICTEKTVKRSERRVWVIVLPAGLSGKCWCPMNIPEGNPGRNISQNYQLIFFINHHQTLVLLNSLLGVSIHDWLRLLSRLTLETLFLTLDQSPRSQRSTVSVTYRAVSPPGQIFFILSQVTRGLPEDHLYWTHWEAWCSLISAALLKVLVALIIKILSLVLCRNNEVYRVTFPLLLSTLHTAIINLPTQPSSGVKY